MNIHRTHRIVTPYRRYKREPGRHSLLAILGLLLLLLAACSSNTGSTAPGGTSPGATGTSTVPVNGFGGANNHGHSLIALPHNVLMLATHFGLFRSPNNGTTWQEVAAGANQPMDGLMTTSLVNSPLNFQRLYVLTQPAVQNAKGTLGLYTSADGGLTWQLTVATKTIGNMYFVAPGNNSPEEAYIYLPNEGPQGLKVSHDAGQHFANTGALPFSILGLFAIPAAPGQLIAYGDNGMARSSDDGNHWQVISGTTGGIFGMTTSGPQSPIYASGDAGIYASNDGGKTFKVVYAQSSFGSLIASPVQTQLLYGKTGQAIYRSTDGGHSWTTLPPIKGNLQNLMPDLHNSALLYLSLSYPMQVYRFSQNTGQWASLTPKA
ncbi:MAG: exo-alpha-sialidase [Ktedonobacteraceae bacterium]|nr:exo-alpha-sialidase [Ktedonobacteraceae bacterium]